MHTTSTNGLQHYDLGHQNVGDDTNQRYNLGHPDAGAGARDDLGAPGSAELGKCDLSSEDLGRLSHSLSAQNALMHLREESTTEADYTLDKELKLGQHYDLGHEGAAGVPVHQWVSDIDKYLSVSNL